MRCKERSLIWLCSLLLAAVLWGGWLPECAAAEGTVSILCYHDVGNPNQPGVGTNPWTVTESNLESHFKYLQDNGYTVIKVEDYIAFAKGERPAPPKAVLLTFDDAYSSFYEKVYPMLKRYNYSAVLSVVVGWLDVRAPGEVGKLVTWQQLKEMQDSGLVEVASHSYDMHRWGIANPQGDGAIVAENRLFDGKKYESEAAYRNRLKYDFDQAQTVLTRELGRPARVMVWPYGGYSTQALEVAQAAGFSVALGLGGGYNRLGEASLTQGKRGIVYGNPDAASLGKFIQTGMRDWRTRPLRMAQVDLDQIYDKNAQQMEGNLRQLIERLNASGANSVALQAFADPNGDGNLEKVYFATSHAPMEADVFGHVAMRLVDSGFRVFAWFPTLGGQWLLANHPEDVVKASEADKSGWYRRATPFSPRVREQIRALANDLSAQSRIDGILLQDDLYLNDFEDFSPAAQAAYQREFGRALTPDVRKDPARMAEWSDWKTKTLEMVANEVIAEVRKNRPEILTLRNIYAEPVLNPQAEEWFGQNYAHYLQQYDYTVLMAYPFMEKQGKNPEGWLRKLTEAALQQPQSNLKVLFKLQTYDWAGKRWLSRQEQKQEVAVLRAGGARHLGYYPEGFFDPQAVLVEGEGREVYEQP
ncbi:poly-beta-1,6-N-acetyl-D-glucosamine N-deacetylase PgaB [Anaeroarcus burkinensis]|uniref:poly-beta-1,6-N-acetyl-D-glucosamine N-deacetylase PgaB n=1 Tax=Anaeroarcus burkinensis TaxID=82376 RepID=UPI000421B85F|nr:poly-beta-1,6-N-acetyl-D-glucosamine N-deacetylase PgaB [Anaeroarcus burkinensis]